MAQTGTSSRALARMETKRGAFDKITLAVADGLFDTAKQIILDASDNAPDSPYEPYPSGEGLPKQGGVLAYASNQKIGGWSIRGPQPRKPRSIRVDTKRHSVVVAAGFGFPARFAEAGTIRMPGRPFLAPARDRHIRDSGANVAKHMRELR